MESSKDKRKSPIRKHRKKDEQSAESEDGDRASTFEKKSKDPDQKSSADARSEQYINIYSRRRYRQLMRGYDIDADSDTEVANCVASVVISDNWQNEYTHGYGTQELANPNDLPRKIVTDEDFHLKRRETVKIPDKLIAVNTKAEYYDPRAHGEGYTQSPLHYDITGQDLLWLDLLNEKRKLTNGTKYLDSKQFIKILESLEEDTFVNIHNDLLDSLHVIYTRTDGEDDGDHECDVCRISECDVADKMVYCDNCNTCVHMLCAGLDDLPPGEWICRKCEYARTPTVPCTLCPALGGSMTYNTTMTEWTHHSCATFVPEVRFLNEEERAPIGDCLEDVPDSRFAQLCAICDTKKGACVTCSEKDCEITYHVCCALRAGCTVRIMEVANDPEGNVLHVTYCHRHSKPGDFRIEEKYRGFRNPWLAKLESVFFLMTSYEELAGKLGFEEVIVSDVYEYWKLKRLERGSALIPGLHDHVKLRTTIDRVAKKVLESPDLFMNKAGISSGLLPAASQNRIQFFRPAALMITELRQLYLKRVGDSIKQMEAAPRMLAQREALKYEMADEGMRQISLCRKACNAKDAKENVKLLMEYRSITKSELKKARENSKAFMDQLKAPGAKKPTPEAREKRPKRKSVPVLSPEQEPSTSKIPVIQTSPLRSRNHHSHTPPTWGTAILPGGR